MGYDGKRGVRDDAKFPSFFFFLVCLCNEMMALPFAETRKTGRNRLGGGMGTCVSDM